MSPSPTARSDAGTYTLTLSVQGQGSGFVTSEPAGISCSTTCASQFPDGSNATLGAEVASGSSFGGFSFNCEPEEHEATSCQVFRVPDTGDETVVVTFDVKPPPCIAPGVEGLSLTAATARLESAHCTVGSVAHAGSHKQAKGLVVSQSPPPKWQNAPGSPVDLVVSKGSRRHLADATTTSIAWPAFRSEPAALEDGAPVTLTVSSGAGGWVTSDPAGIDCATTCSAQFPSGTVVTLTAHAAIGSTFHSWESNSGTECNSQFLPPPVGGPCQLVLDSSVGDTSVASVFDHNPTPCIAPSVKGDPAARAATYLSNAHCRARIAYVFSGVRKGFVLVPKGHVISQDPRPRWREVNGTIHLVVSKGAR